MFVLSLNSKRIKAFSVIAFAVVAVTVIVAICVAKKDEPVSKNTSKINFAASNEKERLSFISQFGWEVIEEPEEVAEILIPNEFDTVYENYNAIQKKQGCDLLDFCGRRVKRWTYIITNYPGYEADSACIRINMLVLDGKVIGGDVCSTELDGFMHTFQKE